MIVNSIIVFFTVINVFFGISYFINHKNLKNLSKNIIKLNIENSVMQEYIDIIQSKEKNEVSDDLTDKENFIKFLSDSRDWAYQYIENVQDGLNKFVSDIDADISYFNEYGETLSMSRPDYAAMKNISKAYKELKQLLPEEEMR